VRRTWRVTWRVAREWSCPPPHGRLEQPAHVGNAQLDARRVRQDRGPLENDLRERTHLRGQGVRGCLVTLMNARGREQHGDGGLDDERSEENERAAVSRAGISSRRVVRVPENDESVAVSGH